ncbi:MAG: RdgB/HAM1 family non-canonical purine NTP pyrophosphatase [Puniceicoccales bacterium]
MTIIKRIIVATGNAHKTEEIAAALRCKGCTVEVVSAAAVGGMPPVDETGQTFADNARLKAEALRCKASPGDCVLADDSGLCVDALDGSPGVYSARYAGPNASDSDNNAKLLQALANTPTARRTARFTCTLVLLGDRIDETFAGECPGKIQSEATGAQGFGYDPLFIPEGYDQSFAVLGGEVKDRLSHRARACEALAHWLNGR